MHRSLAYRTCPLCEAGCGLEITLRSGNVESIRGDQQDVFSQGYLCPKGTALKALHEDSDRLRQPLVRNAEGCLVPATWPQAFAEVERRLRPLLAKHGSQSMGVYLGNPAAHNFGALLYSGTLIKALATRNVFTASTVDQYPKQLACAWMFGASMSVPVPDLDRTTHLLILGANPFDSNGSLMGAPNVRARLRAIRARGGKIVVIDPRRSRTARDADEHHFIRPGADALFLFGLLHVIFRDGLAAPGRLGQHTNRLDVVRELAAEFSPDSVAAPCGIPAPEIERMARELAAAPRAAVYGRMGTTTQLFGTTASWLIDVLNVVTGNLDRAGGVMFPMPAAGGTQPGPARALRLGRWRSRVRGLPELFGELPAVCLAEEIDTPGEGQIRGLITIAGNPALSLPNGARLQAALAALDLFVSVDIYLNDTNRNAHVILPPPSPLERSHYDLTLHSFAVRNVTHYSHRVLQPQPGTLQEWEIIARLAAIASGSGHDCDLAPLDETVALEVLRRRVSTPGSPVEGRDPAELLAALAPRIGPERLLDIELRCGPYGDGFGARPGGLTLTSLEAAPHGIDLGPLQQRIPELLRTPSGKIELAPEALVRDVDRLRAWRDSPRHDAMVMIGRRHLRSNNSWMHNLTPLVRGPSRCTMHMNPHDASRLGLAHGELALVRSRTGQIEIPVEVTDDIMPGVVSIPHGWGQDAARTQQRVAARQAGVNVNLLTDETLIEPVSGTAILNGLEVEISRSPAMSRG